MLRSAVQFIGKDIDNVIRSVVRAIISLGAHSLAAILLMSSTPAQPLAVPGWMTAIFAMVITWYFGTNERGEEELPAWQSNLRTIIRSIHTIGGGIVVSILFIRGSEIPSWWIAIYVSMLTFYFIELRNPPATVHSDLPGE